ncbi:hypothetical protein [Parasphingorhabdus sp.]|uniref:hypothetical protein n=1 Tax=Parasphingorhabdus sp. TaxID=2709688 RepID=UPI003C71111C
MKKCTVILKIVTPILLVTACSDDKQQSEAVVKGPVEISEIESTPDFLPKDMEWMPEDIWLPADFEPKQSQRINPMAETYVLRGITQMTAAELLATYEDRMVAAGYELPPVEKPKPGMMIFRGNGHGTVVIDVRDDGVKRELVVSVENASGN